MDKKDLKEIVEKFRSDKDKNALAVLVAGSADLSDINVCLRGSKIRIATILGLVLGRLVKTEKPEDAGIGEIIGSMSAMKAFNMAFEQSLAGYEGEDVEDDEAPSSEDNSYLDPSVPAKQKTPGERVSWGKKINEILGKA